MCTGTYSPDALNLIYFNFKLSYIFFESKILELVEEITLDVIKMHHYIRFCSLIFMLSKAHLPTRLYRSLSYFTFWQIPLNVEPPLGHTFRNELNTSNLNFHFSVG